MLCRSSIAGVVLLGMTGVLSLAGASVARAEGSTTGKSATSTLPGKVQGKRLAQAPAATEAAPATKSGGKSGTKGGKKKKVPAPTPTPEVAPAPVETSAPAPQAATPTPAPEANHSSGSMGGGKSMDIIWGTLGYVKPMGEVKKYVDGGLQYGLEWNRMLEASAEGCRSFYGLIYRRANLKKDLDPVADGSASKATHTRIDYLATYGWHWGTPGSLGYGADAELGLARRRFQIESGSNAVGDDYYTKTALAYGFRGGLDGTISDNILWRTTLGLLAGSRVNSARLKYDGENVEISGTHLTLGFDLGYAF